MNHEESYFDGGLFQLIGYSILGTLITTATLGICLPWAYCMIYNWEIKHTVIEGRRPEITGHLQQFKILVDWIKWLLLTIVTFGIYGFWVSIKLRQWKTMHTHFVN